MQLASYMHAHFSKPTLSLLAAARNFKNHYRLRSSTPVQLQARANRCSQRGHADLRLNQPLQRSCFPYVTRQLRESSMVQPAEDQSQKVMYCAAILMKQPASLPTRTASPLLDSEMDMGACDIPSVIESSFLLPW